MEISEFVEENRINCQLGGKLDDKWKSTPCWLGIDEAGRGPVLGPMVYGTAYSPLEKKDEFKTMGFNDSKQLTEEQREKLFGKIKDSDLVGWRVNILSPTYISNCMLRRWKYNLNELSHDTAIGLIEDVLAAGVNVREVYVDTVGDPIKYQEKLKKKFAAINITVAKKADSLYEVVGAASICAKVIRDLAVKHWKFQEDIKISESGYGSGYPSDPKTKSFLQQNVDLVFGFPSIVRFSWSTAASILDSKAAPVSWPDDDDDKVHKGPKAIPPLTSFFQRSKAEQGLHRFFTERGMSFVNEF